MPILWVRKLRLRKTKNNMASKLVFCFPESMIEPPQDHTTISLAKAVSNSVKNTPSTVLAGHPYLCGLNVLILAKSHN